MAVGIIGGSGLYEIDGLENLREKGMETPFGKPSADFVCGTLGDTEVVFLSRHGKGHTAMPSEINHKANIAAMKLLGVERIISVAAVGSLREDIMPRDFVLVDQFVDRTKEGKSHTFFGDGIVAHIGFSDPVCNGLRALTAASASEVLETKAADDSSRPPKVHDGGTYLNMEGPAFSTRAESFLYRSWGMDVIGMTNIGEAKLAREAGICYCTMATVTDYDCWHDDHDAVSVEMVVNILRENSSTAKDVLRKVIPRLPQQRSCGCAGALENAIITDPAMFPAGTRDKLEFLF